MQPKYSLTDDQQNMVYTNQKTTDIIDSSFIMVLSKICRNRKQIRACQEHREERMRNYYLTGTKFLLQMIKKKFWNK